MKRSIAIAIILSALNLSARDLIDGADFSNPGGWAVKSDASDVAFDKASKTMTIKSASGAAHIRKYNIELQPGTAYKLSCSFKTENCTFGNNGGIQIINAGWAWSSGWLKPTGGTAGWKAYNKTITPKASSNGKYALVIFGPEKGTMSIGHLRISTDSEVAHTAAAPASYTPPADGRKWSFYPINIIENGDLLRGTDYPSGFGQADGAVYSKTGGHGGAPAIGIKGNARVCAIRQKGIPLYPGHTYKMSAYVKTVNYDAKGGGFVIINNSWSQEEGINPSTGSQDWKLMKIEFQAPPSKKNDYQMIIYAHPNAGEIWFSKLKLRPGVHPDLPEKYRKSSERPELYNIYPIVDTRNIPVTQPALSLAFPYLQGSERGNKAKANISVKFKGKEFMSKTLSLKSGTCELLMKGIGPGKYQVFAEAAVDNQRICANEFSITIARMPEVKKGEHTRLNNMVRRLYKKPQDLPRGEKTEINFVSPRNGWVYVGITPASAGQNVNFSVPVAKGAVVNQGRGGIAEGFRYLPAGPHKVIASAGQTGKAEVVINLVPEIAYDGPNMSPWKVKLRQLANSEWPFLKKHVFNSCNTFIRGELSDTETRKMHDLGIRWMANETLKKVPGWPKGPIDPNAAASYITGMSGMSADKYSGSFADEFLFGAFPPHILPNFARAIDIAARQTPPDKSFYPYLAGTPPDLYLGDFMSSTIQQGGLPYHEAYSKLIENSEGAAQERLQREIVGALKAYRRSFPNAQRNMGFLLGIAQQAYSMLWFINVEADFKYFLDMMMQVYANDPEFDGLAGIGIWTSSHSDDEVLRWTCALFRHYAVLGNKDMLSKKYGYIFKPGHLLNGDFNQGTQSWELQSASDGSISAGNFKGWGKMQGRGAGVGQSGKGGDNFLVMRRSGKPNKASQTIKNLEPGKKYLLQYLVAGMSGNSAVSFGAKIENVRIIPEGSFDYHHGKGRAGCGKKIYPSWRRIIFVANSKTARLTLSDNGGGPSGQETRVNFISCMPYYDE